MTETKNTKNNETVAAAVDFLPTDNPADFKDDITPVFSTGRGLTEAPCAPLARKKASPTGCWIFAWPVFTPTKNLRCRTSAQTFPPWTSSTCCTSKRRRIKLTAIGPTCHRRSSRPSIASASRKPSASTSPVPAPNTNPKSSITT